MRHIKRYLIILTVVLMLTGCGTLNDSELYFSFSSSEPRDSSEQKPVCFNDNFDKLTLNAEIKVDTGSVLIKVIAPGDEVIWSSTYDKDIITDIVLEDIYANADYKIVIETTQTKKASVKITSDEKLSKDKEKRNHQCQSK